MGLFYEQFEIDRKLLTQARTINSIAWSSVRCCLRIRKCHVSKLSASANAAFNSVLRQADTDQSAESMSAARFQWAW